MRKITSKVMGRLREMAYLVQLSRVFLLHMVFRGREREVKSRGPKTKLSSMEEEDCYLVRDMTVYCSHVTVIFGEAGGLPTAVIHAMYSLI